MAVYPTPFFIITVFPAVELLTAFSGVPAVVQVLDVLATTIILPDMDWR